MVMHSKSLRELLAITYETSKCQQKVSSSDLLIFSQFQTYFEKSDNAIPNNFHFCARKDRYGLEINKMSCRPLLLNERINILIINPLQERNERAQQQKICYLLAKVSVKQFIVRTNNSHEFIKYW